MPDHSNAPRWDMDVTRALIFRRFGVDQLSKIRPVLRAVHVRLLHARIHFSQYRQLFDQHFAKPLDDGLSPGVLVFGGDENESTGATNSFFITAEAYVYACLQAMHAVPDNLAHVVYYALGWNQQNTPPLEMVSLHKVMERLRTDSVNEPHLRAVLEPLDRLSCDPSFRLVGAATNHIKHHGGLPISIGLGDDGADTLKVSLGSFWRRGQLVDVQDVNLILDRGFAPLNLVVVEVGVALNAALEHAQNGARDMTTSTGPGPA